MTLKELLQKEAAIHCKTQEEARKLMEELSKLGYSWPPASQLFGVPSLLDDSRWAHGENTEYLVDPKLHQVFVSDIRLDKSRIWREVEFADLVFPDDCLDFEEVRFCYDEINSELDYRKKTGNWNQGLGLYSDEQLAGVSALLRLTEERKSPDVCRCAATAIMCIREVAQVFMHRDDERNSGVTKALRILTEYVEKNGGIVNLEDRVFFQSLCEVAERLDEAWYWARNGYEESPRFLEELILVLQADGSSESLKRAGYVRLLLEEKLGEEAEFNTGRLKLDCYDQGRVEEMPYGEYLLNAERDGTDVVLVLYSNGDNPDEEPRKCLWRFELKEFYAMPPEELCKALDQMAFYAA